MILRREENQVTNMLNMAENISTLDTINQEQATNRKHYHFVESLHPMNILNANTMECANFIASKVCYTTGGQ